MIKRSIIFVVLAVLILSLCACKENQAGGKSSHYESDVYVTDEVKEGWREALVKLISNQDKAYGNPEDGIVGYEPPRPDDPSIAAGFDMGLFDVNTDGVPELLLNMGGGSAGNDTFYVYDIFSGELVCHLNGGGEDAWAVYYDTENEKYMPVGRFDWRVGDSGSLHYIVTVSKDSETDMLCETPLFFSEYEYDKNPHFDVSGYLGGMELDIASVDFEMNGETADFQRYHYALTDFYQTHSLVPHTGVKLYYWSEVSDEDDSDRERAEKMAEMLLFGSGQRFVK